MRRLLLVLVPLALIGCSSEITTTNEAADAAKPEAPIGAPNITVGGRFSLYTNPGKEDSGQLSVGTSEEDTNRLFPANAIISNQLPRGFSPPYKAEDFDNNGSSLGAIFYSTNGTSGPYSVVLAMRRETSLTQQDANAIEQFYEQQYGKPTTALGGNLINYYFWEDANHGQRLMICMVQNRQDKTRTDVTVAVGEDTVMSHLRMDELHARDDKKAVEPGAPSPIGPG